MAEPKCKTQFAVEPNLLFTSPFTGLILLFNNTGGSFFIMHCLYRIMFQSKKVSKFIQKTNFQIVYNALQKAFYIRSIFPPKVLYVTASHPYICRLPLENKIFNARKNFFGYLVKTSLIWRFLIQSKKIFFCNLLNLILLYYLEV